MSLLNSPKANYKVILRKEKTKERNTYRQKVRQGNAYHLDNNNSISVITPTSRCLIN
jgi:hypothetical protein